MDFTELNFGCLQFEFDVEPRLQEIRPHFQYLVRGRVDPHHALLQNQNGWTLQAGIYQTHADGPTRPLCETNDKR
jgi:hypothetical protein